MVKKANKKILTRNWVVLISIYIIGLFIILFSMFMSDLQHTTLSASRFESYVKKHKMADIKNEVENRIDEINYDLNNLLLIQKRTIKNKINSIEKLLLYSDIPAIEDKELRLKKTVQKYEQLISIDEDSLYFILSIDGVMLRSGTDNRLNGNSIIDFKDRDGVYFIREMLKSMNSPQGINITYRWPKTKDGQPKKKTSFCKYIPELNIIIGTGFYEEDILKELQNSIYSRLQYYYKDSESYVFVNQFDGTSLVHANKNLIGKNVNGIMDQNGESIARNFLKIITSEGKGFLTYPYYEKNSDKVSQKISYVESLGNDWGAYIGMGFHTNDISNEINLYQLFFRNEHFNELKVSLLLFTILSLLMFIFTKRGINLQSKYIRQEELIYEELFKLSPECILIISDKGEVLYQNKHSQKILGNDVNKKAGPFGYLNYDRTNEGFLIITNSKNRRYYLEYRNEEIIYKNIDCQLYFMRDITKDYLKANELKQMALFDELTNLPNRRQLLNDFEDIFTADSNVDSVVFGIIDLDHFKLVNDTYGHDIGDDVLKILASSFTARLREGDYIYRYGGEEFIIILKNIDIKLAADIVKNINDTFKAACERRFGFSVTFSGGILSVNKEDFYNKSFELLFKTTDNLLYAAKEAGRNRIEF
ncbi:MAG: diguanylate cyclase (GGDEF)-like protein [Psychromonas sp.]|jgi:diguanylate cyclase (GGDEF)-like protein|uniref:sensor domain-containing diguanylate cyclase n=1 Tax=Psychromonas sp. TaxID=1884585 RepID=UPI0039E364B3